MGRARLKGSPSTSYTWIRLVLAAGVAAVIVIAPSVGVRVRVSPTVSSRRPSPCVKCLFAVAPLIVLADSHRRRKDPLSQRVIRSAIRRPLRRRLGRPGTISWRYGLERRRNRSYRRPQRPLPSLHRRSPGSGALRFSYRTEPHSAITFHRHVTHGPRREAESRLLRGVCWH